MSLRHLTAWAVLMCVPAAILSNTDAVISFVDEASSAGLHATIRCGSPEKRWIPEANGSGIAWLDYDGDGFMDLLIVNGSDMDQLRRILMGAAPEPAPHGVYLFRNLGNGHFQDVTERAGLANPYWGTGANAADYNNDGLTDILITSIGVDLLYRNNGNGTFSEVGAAAGLTRTILWHTGSAFGDFDNDGNLDLFVSGYVDVHAFSLAEPAPNCRYLNTPAFCGPIGLPGQRGILYHNNGNGAFTDITAASGLDRVKPSHSFSAVAADFNHDGKLDLFVANDSDPNFLFLNQGNGTFKEAALESGVAFNADGRSQSNMGVAVMHSGGERGNINVLTTTFADDYFPLFKEDKNGFFDEVSSSAGLTSITTPLLGWACGFADFDNDGKPDLWLANGHVYPLAKSYFQPFVILRNYSGRFAAAFQFPSAAPANSYRGGAAADFDNDGKMDVAILPIAGEPVLLHNRTAAGNSWLGLHLKGTVSNRSAIGAIARLDFCGNVQYGSVRNGGSYLSADDPRLHFGLGACKKIDRLTVRWPTGASQTLTDLPANRYIDVVEPARP